MFQVQSGMKALSALLLLVLRVPMNCPRLRAQLLKVVQSVREEALATLIFLMLLRGLDRSLFVLADMLRQLDLRVRLIFFLP